MPTSLDELIGPGRENIKKELEIYLRTKPQVRLYSNPALYTRAVEYDCDAGDGCDGDGGCDSSSCDND